MARLPGGSSIFQTVLGEIDHKFVGKVSWKNDSDESDDSSADDSVRRNNSTPGTRKRCSHKHEQDKRQRNRVQWIDECGTLPLASESRHCFLKETNPTPKPILKLRANCLIIVSE